MIKIYTTSSCSSCRKAKKWMEDFQIPYKEINLFVKHLERDELMKILMRTENGLDDIVSKRSKVISEGNVDIDSFTISEAVDFLLENPSALKRPIIIDDTHFQIGYNEDEIRAFIPRELRNRDCCDTCLEREDCPVNKIKGEYENESANNL